MRKTIVMAAIGIAFTGAALAQTSLNRTQEAEALAVIIGVGGTCERVVRTQTIGELDDNTNLMAIACLGGEEQQYVIQVDQRGNMAFYSTCKILAEVNNNQVRCFCGVQSDDERRRRTRGEGIN